MPNPKRRHSRARGGKRRAHDGKTTPQSVRCSHCGAATFAHRVCRSCGYYKDRQVVAVRQSRD
jgi:large subunit ribosomal protein L32